MGPRREFTRQKALQDHAEQTGQVCVLEGISRLVTGSSRPIKYEIVEVHVPWNADGAADPEGFACNAFCSF